MSVNYQEFFKTLEETLQALPYVMPEDIPDLPLYMDQVTTLMEEKLSPTRRSSDDKLLTKTMINNYAKNRLLPPPEKKKYTREHLLILVYIYYFKGFLSLQDIHAVLSPMTDRYFQKDTGISIREIYEQVFEVARQHLPAVRSSLDAYREQSSSMFEDLPEDDRQLLQTFAMICSLSMDVYIKKHCIEQLIDQTLCSKGTAGSQEHHKKKE